MYIMWILAISLSVLLQTASAAESARPEVQDQILQDTAKGVKYNKYVAPTQNSPVQVEVHFSVVNFEFKDEANELTSMHIWAEIYWTDPRLAWKPADFNFTDAMYLPVDHIWAPDINLQSSGSWDHHTPPAAWVDRFGAVTLYSNYVIETVCRLNLRYFPFDKQTCTLSFGSWIYYSDVIQLTSYVYEYTHLYKQISNDFKVTKLETYDHEWEEFGWEWANAELSVHMERIASAYSVKLVLPAVVTGFLILMTFLLPPTSQEKVTLAGLIFISLILQLVNLHDLVPASGKTMLGDFLGFAICMDFFAIVFAVLSYYLHNKSLLAVKDTNEIRGVETGVALPMPHFCQNVLRVLRFLDVICFFVFLVVYLIGLSAILGQRQ